MRPTVGDISAARDQTDARTPVVLITGGSQGIRKALAHEFAGEGHHIFLIARNQERLGTVANEIRNEHRVKDFVLAKDLTIADRTERICKYVADQKCAVHILISNAAIGLLG